MPLPSLAEPSDLPIPGYGGHTRNYITQYVAPKIQYRGDQYADTAPDRQDIMSASAFRSETSEVGARLQPEHYSALKKRHILATEGRGARDIRFQQHLERMTGVKPAAVTGDAPDPAASVKRPNRTAHWRSSYQATHGESAATAVADKANLIVNHQHDPNAHKHSEAANILRHHTGNSSYATDYGPYGSDPRQRYDWRLGTSTVNEQATTRGLFDGTAKASEHIPNFAGHVPASHNNDQASMKGGRVPLAQKVNVLSIYNHNLPGYTGHRPECAINDHGPRRPASKVPFGTMRAHDLHL